MLTVNEIHYSYINISRITVPLQYRLSCLSASEKKNAEKFHRTEDSVRFITRKWFYRQVLGKYCDLAPRTLEFSETKYGKPFLQPGQNRNGISFSCSSSQDIAVIGIIKDSELGIDVEFVQKNIILRQVSEQIFTRQEQSQIENSENGFQLFFELWTKKEAFAKASGKGIVYANPGKYDLTAQTVIIADDGMTKYLHFSELAIDPCYASSIALISDNECEPSVIQVPETTFY
jgi:4'-phosphopantetheinyl transferase